MGGKNSGGLFNNWLKNFSVTVFTQTFHAFFLVFILKMLADLQNIEIEGFDGNTEGIVTIMSIVSLMALIKFEKLIKSLFGIEDGMMGDLKTNGAKMLGGAKAVGSLAKTTYEPFKKHADAKRKVDQLGKKVIAEGGQIKTKSGGKRAMAFGDIGQNYAVDADPAPAAPIDTNTTKGKGRKKSRGRNGNSDNGSGGSGSSDATNQLLSELVRVTKENSATEGKSSVDQYNDALKEMKSASRDKWMNTASVIASTSVGAGMFDEASEIAMASAAINKPIATGTTKMLDRQESAQAFKATGNEKFDVKPLSKEIGESIRSGFKSATTNHITDTQPTTKVGKAVTAIGNGVNPYAGAIRTIKGHKANNIDDM